MLDAIISGLNDVTNWLWQIGDTCAGAPWPVSLLSSLFYTLSIRVNDLTWGFYNFGQWVNYAQDKIASILDLNTLVNYVINTIPGLSQALAWLSNWWGNVQSAVNAWWASTQQTVYQWVEAARNQSNALFNQAAAWFANLQHEWDNFKGRIPSIDQILFWWGNWWGNVLAQVTGWFNEQFNVIQNLVNSAFLARDSLWAGWQDMRDNVIGFFIDPVGFIWARFAEWFFGPDK